MNNLIAEAYLKNKKIDVKQQINIKYPLNTGTKGYRCGFKYQYPYNIKYNIKKFILYYFILSKIINK